MTNREAAIDARGLRIGFDGVPVLRGVDFRLEAGEVHALVGANGAGKSTLMKILNGVYAPDGGEVRVFGRAPKRPGPAAAREAGIAMVYQDLSLVPTLTVAENVFLSARPFRRLGLLDDGAARAKTREILEGLGVGEDVDPDARVEDISVGRQQLVEIAKALASDPKVLILDEPTASLSDPEIERLFAAVRRLKDRGIAIVYITHYLRDIFKICDAVTVLRDGLVVLRTSAAETSVDGLVSAMVGEASTAKVAWKRSPARRSGARPLLAVDGLSTAKLSSATLEVYPGEVVGVAGLLGSGRTELLRALYGLDRRTAGRVLVDGKEVDLRSPSDALAAGIALVPEERRKQGLVLDFSVEHNLVLPVLARIRKRLLLDGRKSAELADRLLKHLAVKARDRDQQVRFLSGGNQQKVVVAKCLASEARILLLDDPTFGVDLHSKLEIMRIVREYAAKGMGVVFVSSEFKETAEFCDVVYVMKKGSVGARLDGEATEDGLMRMVQ